MRKYSGGEMEALEGSVSKRRRLKEDCFCHPPPIPLNTLHASAQWEPHPARFHQTQGEPFALA